MNNIFKADIWPVIQFFAVFLAIGAIAAIPAIAIRIQRLRGRAARARRNAVIARYQASLTPEALAEIERVRRIAQERPWEPIAFALSDVKGAGKSFSFRAAGVHRGRAFGFAITFTLVNGPVALCEWSRNGVESEALLDILAEYADVPRADSHFDDLVKTSAIILRVTPSNVPFAQITQLSSKVFFELAEGQPEIYLNLDFASKTGHIAEKNPMNRRNLVRAFQTQ
jgi:hypothetical protein